LASTILLPRLGWFIALVVVLQSSASAQKPVKNARAEQTSFGIDWLPDEAFMEKPVEIPSGAMRVITDSLPRGTINCLSLHKISPEQIPLSWFAGSEIHLDGPGEVDFIVQPDIPKIVAREVPLNEGAGCLLGANIGPFWVIRKNPSGRYSLLLATYALGLQVLDSRTNSYRDIQTGASTATTATRIIYKMAVAQYEVVDKKTDP